MAKQAPPMTPVETSALFRLSLQRSPGQSPNLIDGMEMYSLPRSPGQSPNLIDGMEMYSDTHFLDSRNNGHATVNERSPINAAPSNGTPPPQFVQTEVEVQTPSTVLGQVGYLQS